MRCELATVCKCSTQREREKGKTQRTGSKEGATSRPSPGLDTVAHHGGTDGFGSVGEDWSGNSEELEESRETRKSRCWSPESNGGY